jgi:Kyakuja-Dileera-Zisupton transposase
MSAIVDTYMKWMFEMGDGALTGNYLPPPQAIAQGTSKIKVFDMFSEIHFLCSIHILITVGNYTTTIEHIAEDVFVTSALVRHGLVPCAPFSPTAAFTIRTLEFYRVSHNRSPSLSTLMFVKTLCDLHTTPFKPYFLRQFSICYDLYLEMRRMTDERVQVTLNRNSKDYRISNNCPACTYRLTDEPKLVFSMLYTVDGNDSLKRIIRREAVPTTAASDVGITPVLGACSESTDTRVAGQGIYLTNAFVDTWSKDNISAICPTYNEDEDDGNPCADRWRNMKSTLTSKMWGVFEETGLFLALCRHGFVLMMADMIRSGELSKYALAVVQKMIEIFGADLGLGYDIGCRFRTTLDNSPLGPKARQNNHRCLVGAFHGHAHNRLCQSQNLATYVTGLGLEDLEGNERFFSKSNSLASSTRYASTFHRRQAIANYAAYTDTFETYQNLSM